MAVTPAELAARREHVIALCTGLAEAAEEPSGRHVRFAVRTRTFGWLTDDHHGDGRLAFAAKARPGEARACIAADPERYTLPAYLGHRGWVAIALDLEDPAWDAVEALAVVSYALVAPKGLAARLGPPPAATG